MWSIFTFIWRCHRDVNVLRSLRGCLSLFVWYSRSARENSVMYFRQKSFIPFGTILGRSTTTFFRWGGRVFRYFSAESLLAAMQSVINKTKKENMLLDTTKRHNSHIKRHKIYIYIQQQQSSAKQFLPNVCCIDVSLCDETAERKGGSHNSLTQMW